MSSSTFLILSCLTGLVAGGKAATAADGVQGTMATRREPDDATEAKIREILLTATKDLGFTDNQAIEALYNLHAGKEARTFGLAFLMVAGFLAASGLLIFLLMSKKPTRAGKATQAAFAWMGRAGSTVFMYALSAILAVTALFSRVVHIVDWTRLAGKAWNLVPEFGSRARKQLVEQLIDDAEEKEERAARKLRRQQDLKKASERGRPEPEKVSVAVPTKATPKPFPKPEAQRPEAVRPKVEQKQAQKKPAKKVADAPVRVYDHSEEQMAQEQLDYAFAVELAALDDKPKLGRKARKTAASAVAPLRPTRNVASMPSRTATVAPKPEVPKAVAKEESAGVEVRVVRAQGQQSIDERRPVADFRVADFPSLKETVEPRKPVAQGPSTPAPMRPPPTPPSALPPVVQRMAAEGPPCRPPPPPPRKSASVASISPASHVAVPVESAPVEDSMDESLFKDVGFFNFLEEEDQDEEAGVRQPFFRRHRQAAVDDPLPSWSSTLESKVVVASSTGSTEDLSGSSDESEPKPAVRPARKGGISHFVSGDTTTRKLIAEEAALHAATAYGDWPKNAAEAARSEIYIRPAVVEPASFAIPPPPEEPFTWTPCPPPGSQAANEAPRTYALDIPAPANNRYYGHNPHYYGSNSYGG